MSAIYANISASLGVFLIFSQAYIFVSDISVNYRYIGDIERFFPIFPRNDFFFFKSCRDGPTPEISTIYRQYFATFLTMVLCSLCGGLFVFVFVFL